MILRDVLVVAVAAVVAGAAAAADAPVPEPLAIVPGSAVGFFYIPSIKGLENDLRRFGNQTGWKIGEGDRPLVELIARRTGIRDGIDADGGACIAFLDPKRFRQRYTVYVLPVADWDTLLKSTLGEELAAGQYALTGTAGPRFVARRGKYAIVASSMRTLDATVESTGLPATLSPETLERVRAAVPLVYVNVHQLKLIYESEIASWFRAASGQVYSEPDAVAYADVLVAYMLGIASFIDQIETAEAVLKFGPEGLGVDVAVRFVQGAGVAQFLSVQRGSAEPLLTVPDRTLVSATSMRIDPATLSDFALRATRFFLESAPRPEPLPEPSKDTVYKAVKTFVESLGENMTFLTAPAAPGMGMMAEVTILELKDPQAFRQGLDLLVTAWETLADQLDLYLKFQAAPEVADFEGVPMTMYAPRLRFGIPARHVEFRERLKALYGPDGLVYRVAIVGNRAVIATGSDLSLLRQVLERLKTGKGEERSPAVRRLMGQMPQAQNVLLAINLPLYLGQSLLRGGTPEDRLGTIDPGHEVVGLGLRADKSTVHVATYWPHEQIRLARELINRAAPELTEVPRSLFEPAPEGPPREGAPPGPPILPPAPDRVPVAPSAVPSAAPVAPAPAPPR